MSKIKKPPAEIKCRCGNHAKVVLFEKRYFVRCSFCQYEGYLKEFNKDSIINQEQLRI